MKRIIGCGIGAFYLLLSLLAFRQSGAGTAMGAAELTFWWGVIAVILGITGALAIGGTLIHTRAAAD